MKTMSIIGWVMFILMLPVTIFMMHVDKGNSVVGLYPFVLIIHGGVLGIIHFEERGK